jgi:sugar/nucleoside kinase (ribokinase family)
MFDIITIGGATRDITFFTDKGKVIDTPEDLTAQRLLAFEYGAKIRSEEVQMSFGGGACNAAATFARMGFAVSIISRIGNDARGKEITENLRKRGIDTSLLQLDEQRGSAFSFIVIDSARQEGERVIFAHKGAVNDLEIRGEDLKQSGWLYVTGMGDGWKNDLAQITQAVAEGGIHMAWNPGATEISGGKENLVPFLRHAEVLILNKDEAIELVRSDRENTLRGEDLNDAAKLIRAIGAWGLKIVVLTDGRSGAYVHASGTTWKASAVIGKQADTTGAGDAFGSGFVAGYMVSSDPQTALRYAILNSSGEVTEVGAESGILTREEIEKALYSVDTDKIN